MNTLNPPLNSTKSLRYCEGTLILDGFSRQDDPRLQLGSCWKWRDEISAWHTQAYHYAGIRPQLINGTEDKVPGWNPINLSLKLPPLRDYQKEAKARWMQSHAGIIVLPTGAGKTAVGFSIMADLAVSTLIVCPTRDLMYQWAIVIEQLLAVRPGIIGDSRWEIKDITATTYASTCVKMPKIGNRFGLIIFDECHHLPGRIRSDSARLCAAPYRLGLTATLPHKDLPTIEDVIGPVVYNMKIRQASGKVLASYKTIRRTVRLSPEESDQYHSLGRFIQEFVADRLKTNPEFDWEDIQKEQSDDAECRLALAAHRKRNSIVDRAVEKLNILEDLFRSHPRMPTIIFTGSNVMAREVSKRFLIPCILSENGRDERKQILQGFADHTYPAIVANQILDEGIDIPAAKVAIILGGSASSRQAEQRLGRILRRQGNIPATLYEIVCAGTAEEKKSSTRRKSDAYHQ